MKSGLMLLSITLVFLVSVNRSFSINSNKPAKIAKGSSQVQLKSKKVLPKVDIIDAPEKKDMRKLLRDKLKTIPERFHKYFQYLDPEKIITKPPYIISSCDQLIFIPCTTVIDKTLKDVIKKEKCFLNINFHNVVLYTYSTPDTMNDFADLQITNPTPAIVQGDPNCVYLNSQNKNKFNFCVKNLGESLQLIEAIKFYHKCSGKTKTEEEEGAECLHRLLKRRGRNLRLSKTQRLLLKQLKKKQGSLFKSKGRKLFQKK